VAQICVVHKNRNACKYVLWKDRRKFTNEMKSVYNAPSKESAKLALEDFATKWNHKYAYAIKS